MTTADSRHVLSSSLSASPLSISASACTSEPRRRSGQARVELLSSQAHPHVFCKDECQRPITTANHEPGHIATVPAEITDWVAGRAGTIHGGDCSLPPFDFNVARSKLSTKRWSLVAVHLVVEYGQPLPSATSWHSHLDDLRDELLVSDGRIESVRQIASPESDPALKTIRPVALGGQGTGSRAFVA